MQIMAMDPRDRVRVYTRQDPRAWEEARVRGYLTGSHQAIDPEGDHFDYQYEWMRRRMAERVPGFSGDLPVWAWPLRQNERKWVSSWDVGERKIHPTHTRITALIPRARVLLSCYDLWHAHLNNWPVSLSAEEQEDYDTLWPHYRPPGQDPEYQAHTEANWEEVFNVHLPRNDYLTETHGTITNVQVCVDRIYLDEVVDVRWAG